MQTFRVFGTKYITFQTFVSAADEYEAIEIANSLPAHNWSQVEDDDVIEATDVFLDDAPSKEVQLNTDTSDDWPTMDSGIIVGA